MKKMSKLTLVLLIASTAFSGAAFADGGGASGNALPPKGGTKDVTVRGDDSGRVSDGGVGNKVGLMNLREGGGVGNFHDGGGVGNRSAVSGGGIGREAQTGKMGAATN
jgi:hypothetical protein